MMNGRQSETFGSAAMRSIWEAPNTKVHAGVSLGARRQGLSLGGFSVSLAHVIQTKTQNIARRG